jgi:exonuclease III
MKIISWNIRGLNGCSKQKMLRDLIFAEKPDIVLLQETKCTTEDIDRLLPYCWKQGEATSTAAIGTAGGLAILWNTNSLLLENFVTTKWSITADYRLIGSNKPGHLTNVYGPANPRDKQAFLRNLEYLSNLTRHNRWIVGGDFNLIRSLEEKKGGSRCLDQDSSDFNSLIDNLNLIDLEAINGNYTWTNRRTGSHQIACKLDRFLISDSLMLEGTALEASILNIPARITGLSSYGWMCQPLQGRNPSGLNSFGSTIQISKQRSRIGGGRQRSPAAPRCTDFSKS